MALILQYVFYDLHEVFLLPIINTYFVKSLQTKSFNASLQFCALQYD